MGEKKFILNPDANNYCMQTSRTKIKQTLLCQSTPAVLAQKQDNKTNSGALSLSSGQMETEKWEGAERVSEQMSARDLSEPSQQQGSISLESVPLLLWAEGTQGQPGWEKLSDQWSTQCDIAWPWMTSSDLTAIDKAQLSQSSTDTLTHIAEEQRLQMRQ